MKRITPRTCLWPLVGCLICTFALSVGLTYRSDHYCYAGTCGEWLFPFQARLHVSVWYMWITLSVTFLGFRAFYPLLRRLVHSQAGFNVPRIGKPMRLSGILVIFWVLSLYGILISIWWIELRSYFDERGEGLPGNDKVAAVALTGHLCDVTMGMVLLPVSRHSALASFFKLSPATTFLFHMIQAHILFGLVIVHGSLYASWTALYNQFREQFRPIFPVLNPTYLYHEVWPGNDSTLGIWRASLIFTGITSSLIMLAMLCTSFPVIRRKHFNLFYFTHLCGIGAVIIICLHASTMLYCTLPGLSMWLLDWGMRIYELRGKLDSQLSAIGNGWYCLTLPMSRSRLSGCACHSPLAHFYIHHSESSLREVHPFTTITHLASKKALIGEDAEAINIQFLFRKSASEPAWSPTGAQPRRKSDLQWTNRLALLIDEEKARSTHFALSNASVTTAIRLEGPYFTPATPANYTTVLCLVAGTGLSGALAIAAAFCASQNQADPSLYNPSSADFVPSSPDGAGCAYPMTEAGRKWRRCLIFWSVREADWVDMPFLEELRCPGFELHSHITGPNQTRLDMDEVLEEMTEELNSGENAWVYLSGPGGFIDAGERACRKVKGLEWFAARWD